MSDAIDDGGPMLDHMSTADLVAMMGECARSDDPSDQAFAKSCRDEIARRKPAVLAALREAGHA